ncbi:MAG: DegT/DnrJ/EryC1/StrS family aminotransferase [Thaumarchaeota archaeon]|nr:DegT/DnrJ/EryC1/StrS family aminotransferase [Nitrososphaerota archaeon]
MERIPVAGPWITEKEIAYVQDAVSKGWYDNAHSYIERFEAAFAEYLSVKHAISLPSCTSAIHLSLLSLGIGPGDEVIVPEITWIATAAPISYVGATPVFADIDRRGWCLSPDSFEQLITPRTKAVIPVDLYGGMPNMGRIARIARKHGIAMIEDAAEAIGSEYKGRKSGTFGVTGVFSFHGSKTLTTGEGGMLVTSDDEVYRKCMVSRDHGRRPGDKMFRNVQIGYKYKMSNLQAAMGLAQLERIDELIEKKRLIFEWYRAELEDLKAVTLNHEDQHVKNTYWMVTIILDKRLGMKKEQLISLLWELGRIDCRPYFDPLSSLPAYYDNKQATVSRTRNKNAYEISQYGVNLPSALNLSEGQVRTVCRTLKRVLPTTQLRWG